MQDSGPNCASANLDKITMREMERTHLDVGNWSDINLVGSRLLTGNASDGFIVIVGKVDKVTELNLLSGLRVRDLGGEARIHG